MEGVETEASRTDIDDDRYRADSYGPDPEQAHIRWLVTAIYIYIYIIL